MLEWLGYTDRESRDDKARSLKAENRKHIVKYSTHESNSRFITWVVCWDEPTAQENARIREEFVPSEGARSGRISLENSPNISPVS